ncbi:Protein hir2 [Scheffersomyces spartinae]|uniref:Protein HIR n=1 Tax=Scheffersomyces spartinae TaxID=45513 RepID=A0A9P8AI48_9ASCO|nr:Protein hir2 [Scheffersomyces spartinae]KAG7193483.1 Protein hir2 [Scheffersomyces spartinae]
MRFIQLPNALHKSLIDLISLNSSNQKLATGGKDGTVYIWNALQLTDLLTSTTTGPDGDKITNASVDDVKGPDPISTIAVHKCPVTLVRWSPTNESTLITGDENNQLYIHIDQLSLRIYPYPQCKSEIDFDSDSDLVEVDSVIDISWSHDGRLVAWSTSYGEIHLYDIKKHTHQTLTSLINGGKHPFVIQRSLAFDPTNNYLMSIGDDTLIYLFQYAFVNDFYQFRLISKISKIINKQAFNSKYKRISWSPDGEFASIPSANRNSTSLISLVSRSLQWQHKVSLVGHDYSCEVISFNPKIYQNTSDPERIYSILASAGSDKVLAIWNTTKDTPLLVMNDISSAPVVDMCWNSEGNCLYLASQDGHLSICRFEDSDLGIEISKEKLDHLMKFEKEYLKPLNHKYEVQTSKKNAPPIEYLNQKDAVDITIASTIEKNEKNGKISNSSVEESNKLSNSNHNSSDLKSGESTSLIPEIPPAPEMDAPEMAGDALLNAMESRLSKGGNTATQMDSLPSSSSFSTKNGATSTPPVINKPTLNKVVMKNGKKRIQPTLITKTKTQTDVIANAANGNSQFLAHMTTKTPMEFDKPSYSVTESLHREFKRSQTNNDSSTGTNGPSSKKLKRDLEPVKFIGSVITNPNVTFSKVRLSVPKIRMSFTISSKMEEVFVFDVKNGSGNETRPSRVTYYKKDKMLWCDFIPRFIQLATEGSQVWSVCTSDGQIIVYSKLSGKRLLPPLVLGAPLSFLESFDKYLMAVTCVGDLFVWDLETKTVHINTQLTPLLNLASKNQNDAISRSENITMCSVTRSGIPIATLANGSGYLFNSALESWQTITESWWAFGSHYWDSNDDNTKKPIGTSEEPSIIDLLEHKTNEEIIKRNRAGRGKYFNKISKNMIMKEGFESLENTISLSHLENRILCCQILGETKDFKRFFVTYVQRLCELGHKAKLFDICDQLLKEKDELSQLICGLDRILLLKEVILSCASYRDSQRVLVHFAKKIGVLVNDVDGIQL